MIKKYLVVCYGILVKAGKWNLEEAEGDEKQIVPNEYQIAVAEYLAGQN
ncbi:hypothetical protein CLPU_41c00010 [Gottschalkia purinilytica]|uniref:Uncharacterized protein n=1 Tax=Gottschalkia purinilytica TaxID=1503 RepID=A0A0L0W6U6_GOTPU|nr:CD1375 family protein [Gottschalkia purinilytica]KNF06965.1 hypothetical protein CLPU_41c00010 [Gottschalkia purinilytica]